MFYAGLHNNVHFLNGKVAWYANRKVNKPNLFVCTQKVLEIFATFIDLMFCVCNIVCACITGLFWRWSTILNGLELLLIKIHVKFTGETCVD